MDDEGRIANRVLSIPVDPGIQRGEIHVLNLLSLGYIDHLVERECINASS